MHREHHRIACFMRVRSGIPPGSTAHPSPKREASYPRPRLPNLKPMGGRRRSTWFLETVPGAPWRSSSSSPQQSCTVFALTEAARKGCCRRGSIFRWAVRIGKRGRLIPLPGPGSALQPTARGSNPPAQHQFQARPVPVPLGSYSWLRRVRDKTGLHFRISEQG